MEKIKAYLQKAQSAISQISPKNIDQFLEILWKAYLNERTIFIFGNGGSAANASHFAQDLTKGTVDFQTNTKRFRVIGLVDNVASITALANDIGYDAVFEQQLIGLAKPDDIAIAVSCSGNSPNVVKAIKKAKEFNMTVVGFTDSRGGEVGKLSDCWIPAPTEEVCLAEAVHSVVMHLCVEYLKEKTSQMSETMDSSKS